MNQMEAIQARHSVRQYLDTPIQPELAQQLQQEVTACNQEGRLNIQLIFDDPRPFDCLIAKYGKFKGVRNYLVMAGEDADDLDERCGYYGERLVLLAQRLGLNTCWVALTYKKVSDVMDLPEGQRLVLVIALGYGVNQGKPHKSKEPEKVSSCKYVAPWFMSGVKAALLAPTAMNQQRFKLICEGSKVRAIAQCGPYTKVDLGIVKYHFEVGSGKDSSIWA